LFFFTSGTFVVAFNPVSASELVEDSWNTKAPMSEPRGGLGVVAVDGKIYAIGGQTNDGYVGTNERYDPKTDKWITLASMPTPRDHFAMVAYEGNPY
ncbi:MAG: kelch motif-containing protein, partial [Candidatus Bathyarchaeota archaeon]|nr:kelch motif-containing protein [Candidatus Termiticorpusculum sp.]